jgi:hypothetical protein
MQIGYTFWQPQSPVTIGACSGLYRDSFTFALNALYGKDIFYDTALSNALTVLVLKPPSCPTKYRAFIL